MKTSKRILSVLLVVTMLFSISAVNFSFAAQEVEYCTVPDCAGVCEWRVESVYGCEENRGLICKVCGNKKYGETVYNHSYQRYAYVPATCMKEGAEYLSCIKDGCYATKVDIIPIDKTAHAYGNWVVTKEATCIELGEQTATCWNEGVDAQGNTIVCGNVKTEIIPLDNKAHIYEGEWTVRTEPTCEYDGESYRICTVCNAGEEIKVLPAHSYTWSDEEGMYEIIREATCSREGLKKVVCTECNTNGTEVIPVNDNHFWNKTEATEGETTYLAPTCTEDGYQKYVCFWHSDVQKTEVIPATGHSFTNYQSDNNAKCGVDGTKTAKCDNCDATDSVTDEGTALKHFESKWIITGGTCEEGLTAYKNCVFCKEEMVASTVLPAGTHPNRQFITVPATCLLDGYKVDWCPDCKIEFSKRAIIEASHKLSDNWTVIEDSTCTREGTERTECSECNYYEDRAIAKKDHLYFVVTPEIPAECLKDGHSAVRYCLNCTYEDAGEVLPAVGHLDANNDDCCDRCYVYFVDTDTGVVECSCFCHNSDGLSQMLFKVFNFFYRLFGIKQTCECGKVHYEGNGFFKDLFG